MDNQLFLSVVKVIENEDIDKFSYKDSELEFCFIRKESDSGSLLNKSVLKEEKNNTKEVDLQKVNSPSSGIVRITDENGTDLELETGKFVTEGSILCLVEAMKLFIEVKANRSGILKEISIVDGELVEYNQQLFVIE